MADWVKLDPIQLGEWLAPLRSARERGEWVTGLQAGALGALLRLGATEAEAAGHAAGLALLAAKKDDKEAARAKKSEAGKLGNAKRWGNREGIAEESQRDGFANPEGVAGDRRGEERRGEENFPQGGNGAPPPIDETPEWKRNKAEAHRREIADLRPIVERLEAIPADKLRPEARARLDKARADIRALETKILSYGLTP